MGMRAATAATAKSSLLLLVLGLLFLLEGSSAASDWITANGGIRIDVEIGTGDAAQTFPAMVAAFGNRNPQAIFTYSSARNLILPPADQPQLCEYPEEALSALSGNSNNSSSNSSIINNNTLQNGLQRSNSTLPMDANSSNNNTSNEQSFAITENLDVGIFVSDETSSQSNINNNNDVPFVSRENTGVALFVSYGGGCLPSDKAIVAAALQQNDTRYGTVTHLVIYNTSPDMEMDILYTLTGDDKRLAQNIVIVFVSTRSGRDILEIMMEREQKERFANPMFLGQGNDLWYLPITFQAQPPTYDDTGAAGFDDLNPYNDNFGMSDPFRPERQANTVQADNFYWFRLVVFSLLIFSPCFRAGYLWYSGGARIRFRYNEQGRIVGLQYTPPMPYWFAPRPDDSYEQPATRMTPEQVMDLPEIVYGEALPATSEPLIDSTVSNINAEQESETTPEQPKAPTIDINEDEIVVPGTTIDDYPKLDNNDDDNNTDNKPTSSDDEETENADEEGAIPRFHDRNPSEMHSTCSICIDDFEAGEKVRMLPRCRHIFHTDCILPWLTERQGCCPLCKTEVIEPEHGEEVVEHDINERDNGATESVDTTFIDSLQTSSTSVAQETAAPTATTASGLTILPAQSPSSPSTVDIPGNAPFPASRSDISNNDYDRLETGTAQSSPS